MSFFWKYLSTFIIRQKFYFLLVIGAFTLFFAHHARHAKMSYKFSQLLPKTDTAYKVFEYFEKNFGNKNEVMVIAIEDEKFWQLDHFLKWSRLSDSLKKVSGVENVLSIADIYTLEKDAENKKFNIKPLIEKEPQTQQELDSIKNEIFNLPFYDNYIYTKEGKINLMAIGLNKAIFNSDQRQKLLDDVLNIIRHYEQESNTYVYKSGLPYIRAKNTQKVKKELNLFLILSALVTSFVLLFLFRSVKILLLTLITIGIAIIFALGLIALLGYEITILTGLVPSLLIVIGMPNAIYLINRYHQNFVHHGHKLLSLSRVIEKVGKATFLTNMTTAIGFATFIFTQSSILVEFGVVASLCVIILFFLTLTLLPIFLSMFEEPQDRHIKHLKFKFFNNFIDILVDWVQSKRRNIYLATFVVVATAIWGITLLKTTGRITDDLPEEDSVIRDLNFFEQNFHGVLPLEIIIDTQKKKGVLKLSNLRKIEKLGKEIEKFEELSRPLSIVEGVKFLRQAFYNGNKSQYKLINNNEISFFSPYLKNANQDNDLLSSFVDTNLQVTRISSRMADIGTDRMNKIFAKLKPEIDSIFDPAKYKVFLTGNSVVFSKGTEYLVNNLLISIGIAIVVISVLMAFLFYDFKMVIISVIPNIIPLLATAAFMGFAGIPLKPSTILVFSIAFGISVDDTIHYLAKFQQELKIYDNIKEAALHALKEAGSSMVYTSLILFFGFSVFIASEFGGTKAMGILISLTLIVAMLTNLLLLPSLLLSLDRSINLKALKEEQLLEILDEEEDIDLDRLQPHNENSNDRE